MVLYSFPFKPPVQAAFRMWHSGFVLGTKQVLWHSGLPLPGFRILSSPSETIISSFTLSPFQSNLQCAAQLSI